MICYVLAMGKQHLGPHAVVGYGIKMFWPGLFITSPDHLDTTVYIFLSQYEELNSMGMLLTDTQRKWVTFLKEAAKKKPPTRQIRPKVSNLISVKFCFIFIF